MKAKKIISLVLAVLTLVSSLSVAAFAKESAVESGEAFYEYYENTYASQQARVDKMTLEFENDNFRMYFDKSSGEFAIQNKKTLEYTFSNPYDMNVISKFNDNLAKNALLSQIMIEYSDTATNASAYLSSFGSAATEGQLSFKTLVNGVRVEYALGTVETKRLIPIRIEATRFETLILAVLKDALPKMTEAEKTVYNKMSTEIYYKKYDQTDPANAVMVDIWRDSYSCLQTNQEMIIYVFQGTERSKSQIEKLIRKYCPAYTYDELEYDHELTEYEVQEKELPLFRLAVEYTFDDKGFTATIPAKSIRYNSTNYTLTNIVLLPYFGCTTTLTSGDVSRNGGYIFIPDGSGTLLEYFSEDGELLVGSQRTSAVYGQDYAKETLAEGIANAVPAKVPVFGLTEEYSITYTTSRVNRPEKTEVVDYSRGFTGIVTEGESFADIVAELGAMAWANLSVVSTTNSVVMPYNTVYVSFATSQGDTVEMGGTLGTQASMSTTIDTKYTGNYSVKYVMLSDDTIAKGANADYYESSYVGMANAYRDYLIDTDQIQKLANAEDDIPLYIQSFGSIKAKSTFLTFPVTVTTPLTTFDDVETMANFLLDAGIKNQNFILTGFGNGTASKTYYPTYVSWESKLGGKKGFKDLLSYADENGISVVPSYDFMLIEASKLGFSMDKNGAKTMSGRYAVYRDYDYIMQQYDFMGKFNLTSAGALQSIYNKFNKQYSKYDVNGLAPLTMGNLLNSDFDEEDPLTREDAKNYITDVLIQMKEDNEQLILAGGNSFVIPYATDIIELPLDNSGYAISSKSVPFIGLVLHSYMNYAGTAINMDGDTEYAVLKALENGAGLYFILSYQNTDLVKNDKMINDYYSMMFDTWKDEMIVHYNKLNDAIGDLSDATITAHSFPTAYRMDSEVAAVLFGLYNEAESDYAEAKKSYYDIMAEVDAAIKKQQNADALIVKETAATDVFNAAKTQYDLSEKIINRYNTGDVVSVTYTKPNGVSKTFYINYNTYDVVIENNDGTVFVVGAESFVSNDEIKSAGKLVTSSEVVEAWTYTANQKTAFNTAYNNLKSAVSEQNESLVERRKAAVVAATDAMTDVVNVRIATTASGDKVVINYTSSGVIAKISDTEYVEIASQSYVVIDG